MPLVGTWTFTHAVSLTQHDIINACYRPKRFPWYLQPFPTWTAFIIVPVFSLLSSLANLQPLKSKQLPIMVAISCCSYASNKVANHYIFNRSDVVSAIGAFTVGLLGNIYSRKMGGTAFTSMVTGVLFLVPVSTRFSCILPSSLTPACLIVRSFSSRRYHRQWKWDRHRRGDDCSHYRYHCWAVHEPGARIHVRHPEKRRCFLILKFFTFSLLCCFVPSTRLSCPPVCVFICSLQNDVHVAFPSVSTLMSRNELRANFLRCR